MSCKTEQGQIWYSKIFTSPATKKLLINYVISIHIHSKCKHSINQTWHILDKLCFAKKYLEFHASSEVGTFKKKKMIREADENTMTFTSD